MIMMELVIAISMPLIILFLISEYPGLIIKNYYRFLIRITLIQMDLSIIRDLFMNYIL